MSKKKCNDGRRNNRPPKDRQFGQPNGNLRNTKGRPPGRNILEFDRLSEEALWYCFHDTAQKSTPITESGENMEVPLILAIVKSMANDAARGNKDARRDFLKYLTKSVQGLDKLKIEMQTLIMDYHNRRLNALDNPGSYQHFEESYEWFKSKKHIRALEGDDRWPYEDGEPVTDEDWAVFLRQYKYLKNNPMEVLAWPVKYADDIEAERIDNMTREECAAERLKEFKHRKEMRKKEGEIKWPYLIEEPVDEKDWQNFERHIQDILDSNENPTPWPPDYWDDNAEE